MTIRAVAGYCFDTVLWKMVLDVCKDLHEKTPKTWKVLTPDIIIIDGEDFHIIDDNLQEPAKEFYPPEGVENMDEAGVVWSLGALICYASSGHYVFGGRGGIYQHSHPHVELPTLRKVHSSLTPIVRRCLCYSPSQRISLKELYDEAAKGYDSCKKSTRVKIEHPFTNINATSNISDDTWPEKMS